MVMIIALMAAVAMAGLAACSGDDGVSARQSQSAHSLIEPDQPQKKQPNVLIIVADDMGFADIGPFGSEIPTPSLDALAQEGIRFTRFYTSFLCSPTRAMLLSGTDNHLSGLGAMAEFVADNQQG